MNSTLEQLKKTYDVGGVFYLSDFYKVDGNQHLHKFLTSVYQTEYQNNFRVIVVQDCDEIYDYHNMPSKSICILQKYASQIDISNFFILIVTVNNTIDTELEQARVLYSTDSVAMQSYIVQGAEFKKISKINDTFCVLPWVHLYIGVDGKVLPCCVADQTFPLGDTLTHSVEEILQSEKFNNLRNNMLTGIRSRECARCYEQEDSGLQSSRVTHNKEWVNPNEKYQRTIDSVSPKSLDIRINNLCNLKCRMCSSYFSSAIAKEDATLYNISIPTTTSVQRKNILAQVSPFLKDVEQIYFAGGEPLIIKEHYDILQGLIDCNNTSLDLGYNTNFTTINFQKYNVFDFWNKFQNVTVGASLDAHSAVAEYIRFGTVWKHIESHLASLKTICPHVKFKVTSAVGFLNVRSLIELQKMWHQNNILSLSSFSMTPIIGPDHLALPAVPDHHKQALTSVIQEHIMWCQDNGATPLATQWSNMLNYMLLHNNQHRLSEFRRIIKTQDLHRKTSFIEVFPEFSDLL
jgi:sulfatase maturation enzyme AslB (radical SAM superfamily)